MRIKFLNRTDSDVTFVSILNQDSSNLYDLSGTSYGYVELPTTFDFGGDYALAAIPRNKDNQVRFCFVPNVADKIYVKFGLASDKGVNIYHNSESRMLVAGDREELHSGVDTYVIGLGLFDLTQGKVINEPVIFRVVDNGSDLFGELQVVEKIEPNRNPLSALPWIICILAIILVSAFLFAFVLYSMREKNMSNPFRIPVPNST